MKKIMTLVCVLAMVTMANAATINYKILVDNADVDTINPGDIPVGSLVDIKVLVNVPDSDLGGGYYGGCLQYSFSFGDSADGLEFEEAYSGPPPGTPTGTWKSTSVAPMANTKGLLNTLGYDVLAQTGAIAPGDFGDNWDTFGAGSGVWSEVCSGKFTWSGAATTLTLVPYELTGQLVWGSAGAEYPTASNGDEVNFVPEPATLTLLAFGGLALIRRKK